MNNSFILLFLSPHVFSRPCKYWLSSLYTLFSKTAFFLINSCIFSCFFGHLGYKWVIFLIRKSLRNKAFMSYLCIFWGYKPVFIQFFVVLLSCMLHVLFPVKCNHWIPILIQEQKSPISIHCWLFLRLFAILQNTKECIFHIFFHRQ